MTKRNRITRREVMAGGAVAGVALANAISAPAILAATTAPLKIGVLNTFSGASASTGVWNFNGVEVYLDQVKNTFAGRKVEILKEDDQFNPQVGLEKMRRFVESDKVDLVTGVQGSNIALAVLNYVKQSKAFLLVSGAGTDALTWERVPYLFRSSLASWQLCHPFAEWIYDNLAKEMVLVSEDYAGGRDVAREIREPYIAKGGKITKEIYVPTTVADYSPYLTVVRSLEPKVVYDFSTGGAHAIRFVQQWGQSGIKAKLCGFAGFVDASTIEQQGRAALGVLSASIYTDGIDSPANQRFVADYRTKTKEYPNLFSDYGYVSMQVIDATLQATDGDASNKDKLAEAMTKVRLDAPRGPFRFDPVTHTPIQNVYICEEQEKDGRLFTAVIDTKKDVQAPPTKNG
ncbi:MAG TPA: ABC transporter substrate-binding protein [Stellaceae bacterium]|jgi:branched-chain amino acid transport system substrate-binding protein|nr:ABC transporter substrate-binding protein [Stellaceae bacterium]